MMQIDNELIDNIAELAKLEFNDSAKIAIKKDLENMLAFVDKLNEINTDNVEPMIYVNAEYNLMRDDTPTEMLSQENALYNAPQKDSDYFKVPKFLKGN
jgi:aspartyl-tRNA(Asn)/glutamyl-tRNA(Gln) amidotransferase subunit C